MSFTIPNYVIPANGVAVGYFVINSVALNPQAETIEVGIFGYVSQDDYTSGLQPIFENSFEISGSTYNAFLATTTAIDIPVGSTQGVVLSELISSLQTNMLTLPFFSNATIVS